MSDLMPGAFGSDAMFTLLQDFLKNPERYQALVREE